jgi:hypothetical protein
MANDSVAWDGQPLGPWRLSQCEVAQDLHALDRLGNVSELPVIKRLSHEDNRTQFGAREIEGWATLDRQRRSKRCRW